MMICNSAVNDYARHYGKKRQIRTEEYKYEVPYMLVEKMIASTSMYFVNDSVRPVWLK